MRYRNLGGTGLRVSVIGLGTWKLATVKAEDKSIIIAKNATDAVDKAIDSIK